MPGLLKDFFKSKGADLLKAGSELIDTIVTNKEERDAAKLKLEQEVNRHLEQLEANVIKQQELENADRDSARKREEAFVKATGRADWFQYFIGTAAVLGMFPLLYYVLKYEIPQRNEHIVLLLLGELIGVVVSIYGYHYGSSAGSRFKDQMKK